MCRRAEYAVVGLLVCALSSGAWGEVYRWTDEAGREHFANELSQVPPAQRAAAQAGAARRPPSRLQTYEAPPRAAASASPRRVLHVPYEQHGNAMLVYVRLNEVVTAPFVLDTGAADVVVPAVIAEQAGIVIEPGTRRETYATANGLVRQAVVQLESVEVGEARVEGVRGSVSESLPVGLLGTSFLGRFTMQIDPAARVLTLIPNAHAPAGGEDPAEWSERFRTLRERHARLERYLAEGTLTSESRQRELEERRDAVVAELEALEREADRASVPAAWRE